ncbi:MAG: branched-chain amino acid transport system ATP-binding protein [Chloroflexota bacterium]|nr:branched-chain amino acid transport system ATP-binding protein [Chloroflexota bacterium]
MLRVDRLTAGYSLLPIINEVSVASRDAAIVSVIGPNGSGKSTLLKAMIGLLKPMSGTVVLGDLDIAGWTPHKIVRQGVGYVPQNNSVFPSLSIVENLEMGAFARTDDIGPKVEKVLDSFPDLKAATKKKAGDLSVGQRNLLGVARALMLDPKVILVDEPTAGLAPQNADRIWQQLHMIASDGAAVIVVEQNVDKALEHSEWAYVMVAGRNRLDGPSADVAREDLRAIFLGQNEGPALDEDPVLVGAREEK